MMLSMMLSMIIDHALLESSSYGMVPWNLWIKFLKAAILF